MQWSFQNSSLNFIEININEIETKRIILFKKTPKNVIFDYQTYYYHFESLPKLNRKNVNESSKPRRTSN